MDGQTNTDELRKLPDICNLINIFRNNQEIIIKLLIIGLSKKSILSQQNETEPEKLPEQLFPDSVKVNCCKL